MACNGLIAVCTNPDGEGMWWAHDSAPDGRIRCLAHGCECAPAVYVAAETLLSDDFLAGGEAIVNWEAIPEQASPVEAMQYALRAAISAALPGTEAPAPASSEEQK